MRFAVVLAAALPLLVPSAPATAFHNGTTACSYSDGIVRLRLADEHVVRLLVVGGDIEFADLTHYDERYYGQCGRATVHNTDRILISETRPGGSRLQFDQQIGRFGPGRTEEASGRSEIEVRLGTLTDLWVMGRDNGEHVTLGQRGANLNNDGDLDLIGTELQEVSFYLMDGPDQFSAEGGRGTGEAYRRGGLVVDGMGGSDVLRGSPRRDLLYGFVGNDRIYGRGGNDDVDGGPHIDRLLGGYGADVMGAEGSDDEVLAGPGDDLILANDSAADTIDGGTGSDHAFIDTLDSTSRVERTTYGNP